MSTGVLQTHISHSLSPGIQLAAASVFFGVALIAISSNSLSRTKTLVLLGFIMAAGAVHRFYILTFPASLIGMDPDKYAILIDHIRRNGGIPLPDLIPAYAFYIEAPVFALFSVVGGIVTGVSSAESLMITGVLLGLAVPISVAALAFNLPFGHQARLIAVLTALISVVGSELLRNSFKPIAQSLSIPVFLIAILTLQLDSKRQSTTMRLLFVICVVTLSFLHKLPLVILTGIVVLLYLKQNVLHRFINLQESMIVTRDPPSFLIVVFCGVITVVQLVLTGIALPITTSVVGVFDTGIAITQDNPAYPAAVRSPDVDLRVLFSHHTNLFALMAVGAPGGLWLLLKRPFDRENHVVLASGLMGSVFTLVGLMSAYSPFTIQFSRLYLQTEPVVAILAAAPLGYILADDRSWLKGAGVVLLAVLLTFQIFSVIAVPDDETKPRMYLNEGEVQGKMFANSYAKSPVHLDFYASREVVDIENAELTDIQRYRLLKMNYHQSDTALYDGHLPPNCEYVAYRPKYTIYRPPPGNWAEPYWQLTWNPIEKLDAKHAKIYSNKNMELYSCTDR